METTRNVLIDDEFGDEDTHVVPVYTPANQWMQGSKCRSCYPFEPSKSHKQTWHDMTWNPTSGLPPSTFEFNFTGTSISVYFIIVNHLTVIFSWEANYLLYIDGSFVHNYLHHPDPQDVDVKYQLPIYENQTLDDGPHTFKLQANPTASQPILMLFDYAMYTTPDTRSLDVSRASLHPDFPSTMPSPASVPPTPPPPGPSLTAPATSDVSQSASNASEGKRSFGDATIIGATLGGVSFVMLIAIFAILVRPYAHGWADKINGIAPRMKWTNRSQMIDQAQSESRPKPEFVGSRTTVAWTESSLGRSAPRLESNPPPYRSIRS